MSPAPLPYAPDGLKKFRPALVFFWTMERPKVRQSAIESNHTRAHS